MRRAILYFLAFLLWNLLVGGLILLPRPLPPPLGLLLALGLTYLVLWRWILRSGRADAPRRWAALQLRPLGPEALRATLLAVPALLALSWSISQLYFRLVPTPDLDPLEPYEALLSTPLGHLSLAILAVGVAPIMEEFFFRGLIQSSLTRRYHARWGIALSSLLFALVHGYVWFFPIYFVLGLAFGFVVYATRSIWAGVVLHAANNSVALLGTGLAADPATADAAEAALPSLPATLLLLGLSAAAAAWVGRRLWRSGRGTRLRPASAAA